MSSMAEVTPIEQTSPGLARQTQWRLWARQVGAILRLEVTKNFLSKRAVLIYLMTLMPVFFLAALAAFPPNDSEWRQAGFSKQVFAGIYNGLILRTVVFFGCAWIFMNLFRGEVVDKSLHYYFLAAVRREVLVVGKYFSGLVTSVILFAGTTVVSIILFNMAADTSAPVPPDWGVAALRHALSYVLITVLGCVGYGAIFLVIGLFFRNPIIPALVVYGWEWLNFLLPPLLKKLSVVHYLESLMPVPLPEAGPLAIVAEPTPAWISVPGLLVVTVLVLVIASVRIRRMEIRYGGD